MKSFPYVPEHVVTNTVDAPDAGYYRIYQKLNGSLYHLDYSGNDKAIIQDAGNAIGSAITIGTNDNNDFQLQTNGAVRFLIKANGLGQFNSNFSVGSDPNNNATVISDRLLFTNSGSNYLEWNKDGFKRYGSDSFSITMTIASGAIGSNKTQIIPNKSGTFAMTSDITVTSVFGRTGAIIATIGDYNTSQVTENTNLYYTNARGIGSILTGYVSGAGAISPTDSILSAIQKLNGNISAVVSSQWVTSGSDIYYATGNVMIGNASAPLTKLHVVETSTAALRGPLFGQYSNDTLSSKVTTRKARGTYASPIAINSGDVLSNWTTSAYDGTGFIDSASIRTTSLGTIGTGRTPSKMEFMTMTDVATGVLTTALTLDQTQKATFANIVELTSLSLLDTTYKTALSVLSAGNLILGGSGWTNNIYGDINLRDSLGTYRQMFTTGNNTFTFGGGFNNFNVNSYASFTKTITFTAADFSSLNVSALINSSSGSFTASAYRWSSAINQTGGTGFIAGLYLAPSITSVFTGSTLYGIYTNINASPTGGGIAYANYNNGTAPSVFNGTISSKGFADASNAATGFVGEVIEAIVSTYTNYTTSATWQNITSITLTAGDWDIYAFGTFSCNGATITAGSNAIFNIATVTASATGSVEGKTISYVPQSALVGTSIESCGSMRIRVSISSTTTYYLNTQATFTLLNPQFTGSISARRIR